MIWVDAHADFDAAEPTPSGNIHGMPVACLTGHGPGGLTRIGGHSPARQPSEIRQIGLCSADPGEKRFLRDQGIEVFHVRSLDEAGMRRTMACARDGVDDDTHIHLSVDLDFVDPEIAPGAGAPVQGGPTCREAHLCMEMLADSGRLGSIDLVESLFGKSTLLRLQPGATV